MRIYLLGLLCLSSLIPFAQSNPNSAIIILSIGGSNAVGRAAGNPANEVTVPSGVYEFRPSGNSLVPLTDPCGEGVSMATERSLNPMLGKRVKELTGQDVIILPIGLGNTNIEYYQPGTTIYTYLLQKWNQLKDYCASHNITVQHQFAHWLQGENDAGILETDGYYVELNSLVDNLVHDFGMEKVFATRIGYDPGYASAANSEKIMKAAKILNFNNPNFILSSNAPATFTLANGKLQSDQVHYSLLGQNEVGNNLATAIYNYLANGQKVSLTEPVVSLQSVTNGDIDLASNWVLDFNGNINENNNHITTKFKNRNGDVVGPTYNAEGIVFNGTGALLTSRPFPDSTFTLEFRMKMNVSSGWTTVFGAKDMQGGYLNKLQMAFGGGYNVIDFGTTRSVTEYELPTNFDATIYHTYKLVQVNGNIKLFVDGSQVGGDKVSFGAFRMSWIGTGNAAPSADLNGVIDWVRIRNSVDQLAVLPIGFNLLNLQCLDSGVRIKWSVADAQNINRFEVQRSDDGRQWESVRSIDFNAAGNVYSTDDVKRGTYYRILAIEDNGRPNISQVLKAGCTGANTIKVSPNPTKNLLAINMFASDNSSVIVNLYTSEGRLVKQIKARLFKGSNYLQMDLGGLPKGIYSMIASWNNQREVVKVIRD